MRLVSYNYDHQDQVGVRRDDQIIPLSAIAPQLPQSIRGLLEERALKEVEGKASNYQGETIPVEDIEYIPLIPEPGKIICIGRNYAAHAAEGGAEVPSYPEIFYRGKTSLLGHGESIIRPKCSDKLDYEGEFVFVVGKTCRHASEENALDYIAGYSLFNDATLRDYQRFSSQWTIGKNFDATGAFGPELVTSDELPEGLAGLRLKTELNGEVMQDASIDDLVFPVRTLVRILSECMTLEPGDVVVTGTPAGVGYARKPPVWMKAGDRIAVSIDGLGTLSNPVDDET
ncbi:MAG: fumarylacetoacetate hydrolase family protein [Porticoccaceae bacterium]|jgi:acylpyruvate hydrolase|nr:fumarylacetoacetate hydrolase family protein [Porticoccaceae bacterium]